MHAGMSIKNLLSNSDQMNRKPVPLIALVVILSILHCIQPHVHFIYAI